MNDQNLEVVNLTSEMPLLMENKTIIEYAEQYIKEKNIDDAIFNQINHIRLYKEMIIPAELVRARGGERTNAYNELEKKSLLKQNLKFPKVKNQ